MDNFSNSNWCSPIINNDVVILSAGASTRMQRPKAFLPYDNDVNFVEHLIALYRFLGFRVTLVLSTDLYAAFEASNPANRPDEIAINDHVELGRIHSVRTGLKHVRADAHVVIQDVDRPFVSPELVNALRGARTSFGYTSPIFDGKTGHPILLSPFVVRALREDSSDTLREALAPFPRRDVAWDDVRCDANINDANEYAQLFPEQAETVE